MRIVQFLLWSSIALILLCVGTLTLPPIETARAANRTVCASGCDFTTIQNALNASSDGDAILVGATYDPSGEAASISSALSYITLDCQNSGAIIGVSAGGQKFIGLGANGKIQNCTFLNSRLFTSSSGTIIQGNTFVTSTVSSIHATIGSHFYTITNNTCINDIFVNAVSTATGTISNNLFCLYAAGFSGGYPILMGSAQVDITITSNTFRNFYTGYVSAITAMGNRLTITNNTFDFPVTSTASGATHNIIDASGADMVITGNNLQFPLRDGGTQFRGIQVYPGNSATNTSANVSNNSIKIPKTLSGAPTGIWAGTDGSRTTVVTTSYNIFYSTSTNATSIGITLSKNTTNVTMNNDYNDFFNINTNLSLVGGAGGSLSNARTTDPYFKTKDASAANDFLLAPFSAMLSVNGTHIGSDGSARRSDIYIDPAGTIDYSSVDATSTQDALDNLLSGDTLHLAAGTYSALSIASTSLATSNITVTGAGNTTIINGDSSNNALIFVGITGCAASSLRVQNAGATKAGLAFATSTNCTATSVTSTSNGFGFLFGRGATGNSVNDSVATSSVTYDLYSSSTGGNNSVKNSYFVLSPKVAVSGAGTISAYYKARAYVADYNAQPVAGASVALTDAQNSPSTTLTTGADGYTPYSGYLLASVLSAGDITETSGNYNPYALSVAATTSLAANSNSNNLNTLNQLVTIALTPSLLTPGAPTIGTPAQTTVPLTINNGGNSASIEFAIYESTKNKYVGADGGLTGAGPIWKTESAWGGPITISSLTCQTSYNFSVKARDAGLNESAFSIASLATTSNCPSAGGLIISPPPPPADIVTPTTTEKKPPEKISTSTEPVEKITDQKPDEKTDEKPVEKPDNTDTEKPVDANKPVETQKPEVTQPAQNGGSYGTTTPPAVGTQTNQTSTEPLFINGFFATLRKNTVANIKAVQQFVNSPTVQEAASKKVTPAVVAITTVTVASFITWGDILPLLRYLFLQPVVLLGQRRRSKWGQAYNSLNKLPLDLVTVRLFDAKTNQLIQTRVTDSKGRYAFIAQPGSYRIVASKNSMQFPSVLLSGFSSDGRRADVYHGEVITVTENDAVITAHIPLDPTGQQKRPRRLVIERVLRTTQTAFSWAGLLITAASTYIAPRWYMYPLLVTHVVLLWVFNRLAIPGRIKSWGIVYDNATKHPVGRAIVRLFNKQFDKLVDTAITDNRGRYYFMAGDNQYYVDFDHPSYEPRHQQAVDLSGKEEGTITLDVGLSAKR